MTQSCLLFFRNRFLVKEVYYCFFKQLITMSAQVRIIQFVVSWIIHFQIQYPITPHSLSHLTTSFFQLQTINIKNPTKEGYLLKRSMFSPLICVIFYLYQLVTNNLTFLHLPPQVESSNIGRSVGSYFKVTFCILSRRKMTTVTPLK